MQNKIFNFNIETTLRGFNAHKHNIVNQIVNQKHYKNNPLDTLKNFNSTNTFKLANYNPKRESIIDFSHSNKYTKDTNLSTTTIIAAGGVTLSGLMGTVKRLYPKDGEAPSTRIEKKVAKFTQQIKGTAGKAFVKNLQKLSAQAKNPLAVIASAWLLNASILFGTSQSTIALQKQLFSKVGGEVDVTKDWYALIRSQMSMFTMVLGGLTKQYPWLLPATLASGALTFSFYAVKEKPHISEMAKKEIETKIQLMSDLLIGLGVSKNKQDGITSGIYKDLDLKVTKNETYKKSDILKGVFYGSGALTTAGMTRAILKRGKTPVLQAMSGSGFCIVLLTTLLAKVAEEHYRGKEFKASSQSLDKALQAVRSLKSQDDLNNVGKRILSYNFKQKEQNAIDKTLKNTVKTASNGIGVGAACQISTLANKALYPTLEKFIGIKPGKIFPNMAQFVKFCTHTGIITSNVLTQRNILSLCSSDDTLEALEKNFLEALEKNLSELSRDEYPYKTKIEATESWIKDANNTSRDEIINSDGRLQLSKEYGLSAALFSNEIYLKPKEGSDDYMEKILTDKKPNQKLSAIENLQSEKLGRARS